MMRNICSTLETLKQVKVLIEGTGDITLECGCLMRFILQKN